MTGLIVGNFDPLDIEGLNHCLSIIKKNNLSKLYIKTTSVSQARAIKLIKQLIKPYKKIVIYNDENYDFKFEYHKNLEVNIFMFSKLSKKANKIIFDNGFYYAEVLEKMVGKKRYLHSISSANLAKTIAKWHHLDENLAYISALLHDIGKEYKLTNEVMNLYFKEHINEHKAIHHQYVGAFIVKYYLRINNHKLYQAIKHHTDGKDNSYYSMIIYIADKIEETRGFDNQLYLKKVKANLKKGFEYTVLENEAYLKQKGK